MKGEEAREGTGERRGECRISPGSPELLSTATAPVFSAPRRAMGHEKYNQRRDRLIPLPRHRPLDTLHLPLSLEPLVLSWVPGLSTFLSYPSGWSLMPVRNFGR